MKGDDGGAALPMQSLAIGRQSSNASELFREDELRVKGNVRDTSRDGASLMSD